MVHVTSIVVVLVLAVALGEALSVERRALKPTPWTRPKKSSCTCQKDLYDCDWYCSISSKLDGVDSRDCQKTCAQNYLECETICAQGL